MNEASLRASGGTEAADAAAVHRSNPNAAVRKFGEEWGAWWRKQTGDAPGHEPWNSAAGLNWKPVPSLAYWDAWGPDWSKHDRRHLGGAGGRPNWSRGAPGRPRSP